VPSPPAFDDQPTQAFDFQAPYVPPVYTPPVYTPENPIDGIYPPVDSYLNGVTDALVAQPVGLGAPDGEAAPTSAIDALFGESRFQEYDSSLAAIPVSFGSSELVSTGAGAPPSPPKPPRPPLARSQKILLWAAGGLLAALALVALFALGLRLAPVLSPDPVATPTPTPSSTVNPFDEVLGPVAPGVYEWDELLGTECVEPFVSAWEQEFTVIDCASPHTAQLVHRGIFADEQPTAYPGVEALQARMNLLCTSSRNVDYSVAKTYKDIQFSASFAANEAEWIGGHRDYFCFVTRSGGEPFTNSVAKPDAPAPVIPTRPEPEP
jgi:hypothetical protein